MKPYVSVIIRTYNEEKYIEECLKSVLNQKADFDYEVIVVDSGSEDNTVQIASKYPLKIVKVKREDFSYGRSLNIGCEEANGIYCVFLSAHALPVDEKWLKHLIEPFKDKEIAGVYGREMPREDCNPLEARRIIRAFGKMEKVQRKDCFFSNGNSAVRKELWKELKFDEEVSSTEDHLWAHRMQGKGYAIFYQPKARVFHSHNESLALLYKRIRMQVFDKYRKIEKRSLIYIYCRGFAYFIFSIIADWYFIIKNRRNPYWLFASIPYNATFLLAFLKLGTDTLFKSDK